ncbi:septum formation family protein [Nocardioides lianchengensis]|uniref:Uncharacterized protein n=1 Tax=Nocardioides lianchengensis TaxID=1045774 RepID=A0A1G6Y000_9ACTN|nr:septum formation family protein [Nocardioides lianchengensis]NYG13505.1 hypothetical protein [Nocardioides lianchengensis]SDD83729.1 hypothetical protein SAMN05421872_111151 [Nocardioides lianchengensis]
MRTTTPTLARLLGLPMAAGLVLAGLAVAAPSSAQAADALTGAPAVGWCHDVTIKQAEAETLTTPVVACTADHTLVTTAVVALPANADLSSDDLDIDCTAASRRAIGLNPLLRSLTLYSSFAFLPTAAQQGAGARWYSCHLGVWDTKGLNDLPAKLPKLTKKPAKSVAKCATKRDYVTCAEKHTYRATSAVYVKAKGSDKAVEKRLGVEGPRICAKRAGRTGFYAYYRHTPSKVVLTCFKKTKK